MLALRLRRIDIPFGLALFGAAALVSALALADPPKPYGGRNAPVGWAPDPTPVRTAHQWALTFRYAAGSVQLQSVRPVTLLRPVSTPRRMGRFAFELLSGPTLVDRVRFDFPLLAADEVAGRPRPFNAPPRFETKAVAEQQIMAPDSSRASRARLVDRATGLIMMIPWPPAEPSADAGVEAASPNATDASPDHDAPNDAAPNDAGAPDGATVSDAALGADGSG